MLHELLLGSANDLSRAIHSRQVSCVEVMEATLARIDGLNLRFNAIVSLRPTEVLLQEAAVHDGLLRDGTDLGWMHGFPLAPKDLTDVARIPTTRGSRLLRDNVPAADSLQVQRMRSVGGIMIGKTNTPEHGLGSHTYNDVFGVTGNAWNPNVSSGGSSGGAAVAVALGLLPVADGSDMMGSLRNPAGWNNVYGLRPTPGRVPAWPATDVFFQQLATDGPMARTVTDLANLLSIQAGPDPRTPLALREDPNMFAGIVSSVEGEVRVGWLGDFGGYLAIEPDILQICEQATAELGETRAMDPFFDMDRLWRAWLTLRGFQIAGTLGPLCTTEVQRSQVKPEALWELDRGRRLMAAEVFAASADRSAWHQAVLGALRECDVLALPAAQCSPFPASWTWPRQVAGRTMDTYHRWMEVVVPGSMAAVPTLCIPAGFDAAGMPVGLQLIGRPSGELALLRIARRHELTRTRAIPPAAQ